MGTIYNGVFKNATYLISWACDNPNIVPYIYSIKINNCTIIAHLHMDTLNTFYEFYGDEGLEQEGFTMFHHVVKACEEFKKE